MNFDQVAVNEVNSNPERSHNGINRKGGCLSGINVIIYRQGNQSQAATLLLRRDKNTLQTKERRAIR
ncbi:hypothetical protein DW256_07820 [Ruminococcus sp. AM22-14LB]|nr:hypothetical protein DW256_07820 [Ruminococcus sp. AM22-14LB]RGI20006.1 hypothetical protein DXC84_06175 [Ruminococcus sp. TF08-4]